MTQNEIFNRKSLLDHARQYNKKYYDPENETADEIEAGIALCQFTDKESYLEWVKEWKKIWHELSNEQTKSRIAMSKPHNTPELTEMVQPEGRRYSVRRLDWYRFIRADNKWILRILIHARHHGKKTSWKMKMESK